MTRLSAGHMILTHISIMILVIIVIHIITISVCAFAWLSYMHLLVLLRIHI